MVAKHAVNHPTAMEELGSPNQPFYGQLGKLVVAYDWIFYQQHAIRHIKHMHQWQVQYEQEYEEVVRKICGYRSFVTMDPKGWIILASLKDPNLVLPLQEMRAITSTPQQACKWVEDTEVALRFVLCQTPMNTSLSEEGKDGSCHYDLHQS